MKSRFGLAAAGMLWFAAPANAAIYLYEINALADEPSSSITGSFTMDSSIGPASISNVDIHATIGTSVNFTFNDVIEPALTWPIGYLWFFNDAYYAGDTNFRMGFHQFKQWIVSDRHVGRSNPPSIRWRTSLAGPCNISLVR